MVSEPHGGKLIDLTSSARSSPAEASELDALDLSQEEAYTVTNIVHGVFSPLDGFMGEGDFRSVQRHMRLEKGLPWTIPITLNIPAGEERVRQGADLALRHNGTPIAVLHAEEVYSYDKKEYAERIFGTSDPAHPGVAKTFAGSGKGVGGKLSFVQEMHNEYQAYTMMPNETRALFLRKDFETITAFQTRNAPHIGHEYLQKMALIITDCVFVNPVIGKKKPGDFKDEVIINTYRALTDNYYPKDPVVLGVLRYEMQYAGTKEAIMHAIMRKNFGCTHIIIGRDHAGVGSYYAPYAAQEIFSEFKDLGISPLFFKEFYYCKKCAGIANEKICPHDASQRLNFSGTKLRELFEAGQRPPVEFMRQEVSDEILRQKDPFHR